MAEEEEEPLQSKLERHLGPMPRPAARMHLPWIGQVGPFGQSDEEYKARLENWQAGAKQLAPKFAEADLTPMSLKQWSGITGLSPETGATPNQYRTGPSQSLEVPNTLVPPTFDIDKLQRPIPPSAPRTSMAPGQLATQDPDLYRRHGIEPPTVPPMQATPPMTRNLETPQEQMTFGTRQLEFPGKQEINLEAPVNWPQREMYEAKMHQMRSPYYGYIRGMGGANTLREKENMIHEGLVAAGHPDNDETRAQAKLLATGALNQQSQIDRRGAQTQQGMIGLGLKKQAQDMQAGINQHKTALMDAQRQLAEARMKGDTPELRIKQSMLDLATQKLKFLENYAVMADKAGMYNEEAHQNASQYIAEIAGILGDVGAQGFFGSLGSKLGMTEPPKVQRAPSGPGTATAPPPSPTQSLAPPAPQQKPETNQTKPSQILPEDADELRQATEEAMKDPGSFKGREYMTKSGKKYTFTGEKFE